MNCLKGTGAKELYHSYLPDHTKISEGLQLSTKDLVTGFVAVVQAVLEEQNLKTRLSFARTYSQALP